MTDTEITAQFETWAHEWAHAFERLTAQVHATGPARLTPIGTGSGPTMIATRAHYGKVPVEAVLDRTAIPEWIIATEDGGQANLVWHDGPPTGDSVYVERWTPQGRMFHGYVDPTTRKIVQTG